jgi:hypothetical protein
MISNSAMPAPRSSSSPAFVALAWIVVLTPLAWGVYNTVKTSANLFTSSPPPPAATAGVAK